MDRNAMVGLAYSEWGACLVREGWTPYLLTFMFLDLRGPAHEVARTMEREVKRVYATVLTRIVRNPTRPSMIEKLPIWFCALGRPIFKRAKQSLHDVVVNDGRHVHAVAFLPPWSRLPEDLAEHLNDSRALYLRSGFPLRRIDVVPITRRVGYVVGYARKLTGNRSLGEEAGFVLPRALSEVRERAA